MEEHRRNLSGCVCHMMMPFFHPPYWGRGDLQGTLSPCSVLSSLCDGVTLPS